MNETNSYTFLFTPTCHATSFFILLLFLQGYLFVHTMTSWVVIGGAFSVECKNVEDSSLRTHIISYAPKVIPKDPQLLSS